MNCTVETTGVKNMFSGTGKYEKIASHGTKIRRWKPREIKRDYQTC